MSFDDFVKSANPQHRGHISNMYVRFLAPRDLNIDGASDEKIVAECLNNLDEFFDFIGFTDTISTDIEHIRQKCFPKFPGRFSETRVNVSNRIDEYSDLSDEAKEIMVQNLRLDTKIYDGARRIRVKRDRGYLAVAGEWLARLKNTVSVGAR